MRKILAILYTIASNTEVVPVFALLALAAVIGVAAGHPQMYYA